MSIEELKIPSRALQFLEHEENAVTFSDEQFSEAAEKRPTAEIVGYSGGVLEHWYWGRTGINIAGIKFKKSAYPILESHVTDRKIGFSKRPVTKDNKLVLPKNDVTLLNTEAAQEFINLGRQGFPFEASIAIQPTTIKRFDKPTDVALNGKVLKNLDVVFDASIYKEVSVCVFGADSETQSTVQNAQQDLITFTADCEKVISINDTGTADEQLTNRESEVTNMPKIEMTLEQFKADFPELLAALIAEFKEDAEKTATELTARVEELSVAIKDMGASIATLLTENEALKVKMASSSAKEQKDAIDAVWTEALTASTLPVQVHDKVKLIVKAESFMKEGSIDMEAFKLAVETEIKDWESKGFSTEVLGFGSSHQTVTQTDTKELVQKTVKSLAGFLGKDFLKKAEA